MIAYIIESGIIMMAFYGFYHVVLRNNTFFNLNRFYLLFALISAVILPLITIPVNPGSTIIPVDLSGLTVTAQGVAAAPALSSNNIQSSNWSFENLVLVIYGLIVFFLLLKLFFGIKEIINLYQKGKRKKHASFIEVISKESKHPFSFFNLMFLPSDLTDENADRVVREHELTHIRQWHSLDILLVELLRIVFWFNPFLTLYKKAIVQNHEYLADQTSLRITEKYTYGELLLSFQSNTSNHYLSNHFKNSIIKNRLTMMYKSKTNQIKQWNYFLFLPLFLAFFVLFSCKQESEIIKADNTEIEEVKKDVEAETNDDMVFEVVEEMPVFPGCDDVEGDREAIQECSKKKMLEFIFSNLKYPEEAREKGTEGMVVASFVVLETGKIEDMKIIKDIGEGCGEAVLKVLEAMNEMEEAWRPGKQRNKTVKVKYTLPVKFKLEDK